MQPELKTVNPIFMKYNSTKQELLYGHNAHGLTPSSTNYQQYYQASAYYWVKGIGIIKRELVTATSVHSWTLIRKGKR